MANSFYPASGGRRGVLLFMALGLIFMLVVAAVQRITSPGLVTQIDQQAQQGQQGGQGGMSPEVAKLMQQLSENPNDYKTLIHLADHMLGDQQWDAAENFARRASVVKPEESQPQYLMGIILHNKGQHKEAAEVFEKVIKLKDEASARYSLGVLYIYFLNNASKGVEHLSAALNDPKTTEAMKVTLREELEKVPMTGAIKDADKGKPAPKDAAKAKPAPKGADKAKPTPKDAKEQPKTK